jgi:hypothetical protein
MATVPNQLFWSLRPMTLEQIPMVIDWMSAIDPSNKMDREFNAEQLRRNLLDAAEKHFNEHYIGYFEHLASFYLVVLPAGGQSAVSGSELNMSGEYEVFTVLPRSGDIDLLVVYAWAIHFVFSVDFVGYVLKQVEATNQERRLILNTLGFSELGDRETAPGWLWYGCSKEDFKFDAVERDADLKSGF